MKTLSNAFYYAWSVVNQFSLLRVVVWGSIAIGTFTWCVVMYHFFKEVL